MKDAAAHYLRMATCGLALALAAACVRLAPAEAQAAKRPDRTDRTRSDDLAYLRQAIQAAPLAAPAAPADPVPAAYPPAPELGAPQSMFYRAELAAYPSRSDAEADWNRLAPKIRPAGLEPSYDSATSGVRLSVGPLTSEAAVRALCVELTALVSPCHVAAPAGASR